MVFHWRMIGIPEETRRRVSAWCAARKITLRTYDLTGIRLRSQITNPRLSEATALRLVPLEDLREVGDRVCYLDSDVIVLASLQGLFDLPLDSCPCAAFDDPSIELLPRKQKLGLPPEVVYFNAGILVINSREWMAREISARARAFLYENPAVCPYEDQDALNATIAGDFVPLDERYNRFSMLEKSTAGWSKGRWAIIHFAATPKPWSPFQPSGRHLEQAAFYWFVAMRGLRPSAAAIYAARAGALWLVARVHVRLPRPAMQRVERLRFFASHGYVVTNAVFLLLISRFRGRDAALPWRIAGAAYYEDRLQRLSKYPLGSLADKILLTLKQSHIINEP